MAIARTLSVRNLYDKVHDTLPFTGTWQEVFGTPEAHGAWLIYGNEKQGKTWFALLLAKYLKTFRKVLYVSAEEGIGSAFVEACKRAGLSDKEKDIHFIEYEPLEDLRAYLAKRQAPRIVFVDNMTFYNDELKNGAFRQLLADYPRVLFVFLAHEERGEPYTATAKLCRKIAKIIAHIEGLAATVGGRCKGGRLDINEERAALYHGEQPLNQNVA